MQTGLYSTKQKKKIGPGQPHSPDPNAPEWDWGEDDIAIKEDAHDEEENWVNLQCQSLRQTSFIGLCLQSENAADAVLYISFNINFASYLFFF